MLNHFSYREIDNILEGGNCDEIKQLMQMSTSPFGSFEEHMEYYRLELESLDERNKSFLGGQDGREILMRIAHERAWSDAGKVTEAIVARSLLQGYIEIEEFEDLLQQVQYQAGDLDNHDVLNARS